MKLTKADYDAIGWYAKENNLKPILSAYPEMEFRRNGERVMSEKGYLNKSSSDESIAKKMQIATGMSGEFPPIKSETDFTPGKKIVRDKITHTALMITGLAIPNKPVEELKQDLDRLTKEVE